MSFVSIDPATGIEHARYPDDDPADVQAALDRAVVAQSVWGQLPIEDRTRPLRALAAILRARKEEYGALMTREMGKPISQGVAEAEKCAWVCEYYADIASDALEPVPAETDASRSYWTYRPLGLVLGIMPWNFPFWQVIRFAAPTVTAGNGVLLKHASSVPDCARALQSAFEDAGFPEGLFTNLFVDTDAVGDLIEDDRIRAVSLTGSVRAGKAVAARAGGVLKKCVLELGGSDPSVVLADADLDTTVASCARGRFNNTGQSCIAAKRFIVVSEIADDFEARLVEEANRWTQGDPADPDTRVGPMSRTELRDELHDQVQRSIEAGARLVRGGAVPDRDGAWYPVTILADVGPGMPAYEEEMFGPVATIIRVADESEALRVANDTVFGLGASVYTSDSEHGEHLAADRIEAGSCFVNHFVKSDPRLPFGGIKESGYGRELSPLGLLEFTNTKTVWVK